MVDMVFNVRSHEEITVVISGVESQGERVFSFMACLLQHDWFELATKEIIILSLVYQDMQFFLGFSNQCTSVIFLPGTFVVADVVPQRFFSPGAIDGRTNWCKG